jgi:hypothetical protein
MSLVSTRLGLLVWDAGAAVYLRRESGRKPSWNRLSVVFTTSSIDFTGGRLLSKEDAATIAAIVYREGRPPPIVPDAAPVAEGVATVEIALQLDVQQRVSIPSRWLAPVGKSGARPG